MGRMEFNDELIEKIVKYGKRYDGYISWVRQKLIHEGTLVSDKYIRNILDEKDLLQNNSKQNLPQIIQDRIFELSEELGGDYTSIYRIIKNEERITKVFSKNKVKSFLKENEIPLIHPPRLGHVSYMQKKSKKKFETLRYEHEKFLCICSYLECGLDFPGTVYSIIMRLGRPFSIGSIQNFVEKQGLIKKDDMRNDLEGKLRSAGEVLESFKDKYDWDKRTYKNLIKYLKKENYIKQNP